MARLAIVEDQTLLLSLLHDLCERVFGHVVVIAASSRAELLAALPGTRVEIVLMDLNLPDGNGLEMAEDIRRLAPGARMIAVSGETTPYMLHQAIRTAFTGSSTRTPPRRSCARRSRPCTAAPRFSVTTSRKRVAVNSAPAMPL